MNMYESDISFIQRQSTQGGLVGILMVYSVISKAKNTLHGAALYWQWSGSGEKQMKGCYGLGDITESTKTCISNWSVWFSYCSHWNHFPKPAESPHPSHKAGKVHVSHTQDSNCSHRSTACPPPYSHRSMPAGHVHLPFGMVYLYPNQNATPPSFDLSLYFLLIANMNEQYSRSHFRVRSCICLSSLALTSDGDNSLQTFRYQSSLHIKQTFFTIFHKQFESDLFLSNGFRKLTSEAGRKRFLEPISIK